MSFDNESRIRGGASFFMKTCIGCQLAEKKHHFRGDLNEERRGGGVTKIENACTLQEKGEPMQ